MHKKIMLACMAIAAFAAFVIAPAASASPSLTSKGILVPVGTSITGTSTEDSHFTGGFEVTCTHIHFKGIVTSSGTPIKGEVAAESTVFTGAGTNGDCTSALGSVKVTVNSKLCLETVVKTDTVKTTGCGTNPVTFTLAVTSGPTCKYSTASVSGTFNTNATATVNVVKGGPAKLEEGGFLCPTEGTIDMDVDLYTTDGTLLTIS